MKNPVFRLKALLQYRKFLKTQAAARLAEASRNRARAYELAARMEQLLEELEDELKLSARAATRASELVLLQEGLVHRRKQVEAAKEAFESAVAEEESCRKSIIKIQQEYESVVKLKERHHERVQCGMLREEELALNEFANARYKRSVTF